MSRKIIGYTTLLAGLSGAAMFCCILAGCSRLKHVGPNEFKNQVELGNMQSMASSIYIGQADGRAFLLRKRMPLIGKKWKEEVLYTETSQLGEDFLKKLAQNPPHQATAAE